MYRGRGLPISNQTGNLLNLKINQYQSCANYAQSVGYMEGVTNEKPYNIRFTEPVNIEMMDKSIANTRRKQWATKNQGKSYDTNNNIALYDLRNSTSLNEQEKIGNYLPNQLHEYARNKIHTPNTWATDIHMMNMYGEDVSADKRHNDCNSCQTNRITGYNLSDCDSCIGSMKNRDYDSQLMASDTNVPIPMIGNPSPDERLRQSQQSYQREFRDENGKITEAQRLRNSSDIRDRNRRQLESDMLMKRTGALKQPRWSELNQPYHNVNERKRITLIDDKTQENFTPSAERRQDFKENLTKDGQLHIDEQQLEVKKYDYNQGKNERTQYETINKSQIQQLNNIDDQTNFLNKLGDTILESIGAKKNKQKIIQNPRVENDMYTNYQKCEDPFAAYNNPGVQKQLYNKGNHLFMIKNGEVLDAFPEDNLIFQAPLMVTMDEVTKKPIRTFATANNKYLYIIQKRDQDDIFYRDGDTWNDDYLMVEIPINELTPTYRRRIEQHFNDSERKTGKIIEFTADELQQLADYVDENVNEQLRIKQKTIYDHIRGHQYDQEIALNFDSRNVFLSPELVNANRETLRREKQQVHQRKRQERDLSYIDERITALAHDDTRQVSETMYKARNKVDNRSNIQRIDPFRGRSGTNIMATNIM